VGDTTNVAARLQAAAPAGGILIGQATFDAVRREVEAEPFGDLDLKGKPTPVPTYEVRIDRSTSA
jgi:class 3 adenylate cyclase